MAKKMSATVVGRVVSNALIASKIGCVQHDCADCQQKHQSFQDLAREAGRKQVQNERLVKGLVQIRDSTYRNSTTLRAIAADILDTYTNG